MPALRFFLLLTVFAALAAPVAFAEDAAKKEEPATAEKTEAKKEEPKEAVKEAPKEAAKEEPKKSADKKPAEKKAEKPKEPVNPEDGNAVQEWIAAENKLIDTLLPKDQQTFFIMRNKHGVVRAVRVVDRDIKNAVKACGEKNPDMKSAMNDRFRQWENAVIPVIELAEKFLKDEIETQKIVVPSDFKYVLKLNDKAYEYGESRIEKAPVTSKDACESLLESMDRTENKMVEMLQDMLLPESVIRERAERAEAEKEAAEEAAERAEEEAEAAAERAEEEAERAAEKAEEEAERKAEEAKAAKEKENAKSSE